MPVSRHEVFAKHEQVKEDLVLRLVSEIDERLCAAKRFPVVYEITKEVTLYPDLGPALVELYEEVGWNVRYGCYRDSEDSYGDQRGPIHYRLYFSLEEKES